MEEMWKKFKLSEEEKGVLAVSSQDVSNLNIKQNSVSYSSYKSIKN